MAQKSLWTFTVLFLSIFPNFNEAIAQQKLWVSSDRVERYTCPSLECGIVGQLMFREGVNALETKGVWIRVTEQYDAAMEWTPPSDGDGVISAMKKRTCGAFDQRRRRPWTGLT